MERPSSSAELSVAVLEKRSLNFEHLQLKLLDFFQKAYLVPIDKFLQAIDGG
jgi:hypothetical protein